ncbi:MAG TPA: PQQ-binding-like beta-propeller repeat protein [Longimicrobiales bacterium]|nr:PQQ-binding-like beta-propeller repeat protein [Longimicrobiales bacterium]
MTPAPPGRFVGATTDSLANRTLPAVAELWRVETGRGVTSPLIEHGGLLIATATSRDVTAFDPETGQRIWQRRVSGPVIGGATLHAGRLLVAVGDDDGGIQALDPASGTTLWTSSIGSVIHAPGAAYGRAFAGTEMGVVASVDIESGAEMWRIRLSRPVSSTPLPIDGQIVVTAEDTLYVLAAENGLIRWRMPLAAHVGAAPAARGDTLYLPLRSGELIAIAVNGRRELWRASFGDHPILATPALAPDGAIYVLNRAAELWRFRPGGAAPVRVAELGGAATAAFSASENGALVGRVDGALFLVRPEDGEILWRHDFDDAIRAPVAVHGNAIFVPLLRGTVVKLR